MRNRLYQILEEQEGTLGQVIQWTVTIAILLSAVSFVLETLPEMKPYRKIFRVSEYVFIAMFTVEYILRLYCQPRRLRWALTNPYALIDLLAIVPFYLELLFPFALDARVMRVFRLVRVVSRVLKVGRHSSALDILVGVLRTTWRELVTCFILASIVALVSATGIYYAEHVLASSGGSNFSDMGKCLWWSVVTLTTVGYGDVYPVTALGRLFATIVMLGGIAMIALPAGIIAGAFAEEVRKAHR